MAPFDLTNPLLVVTGTLYGEGRSTGRAGMEDIGATILNRVTDGWASDLVAVCLAKAQFSCWNIGDPNRAQILATGVARFPEPAWTLAEAIASLVLAGKVANRVSGADSYYARSMPQKPYWAVPPARQTYADNFHVFWQVRPSIGVAHAPVRSVHSVAVNTPLPAPLTADELNEMSLAGTLPASFTA